jgi:UDP-N-acetylglucosamine 1-carboxyvinyltransferase
MKEFFRIVGSKGSRTLSGTIRIAGAKNAALKALAASVLFRDPLRFTNMPDIEDVHRISELLSSMGATIERKGSVLTVDTEGLHTYELTSDIAKRLRSSIVASGPILARMGRVSFPHPGGCVIGERPIDLFLEGFTKMGATVTLRGKTYEVVAEGGKLRGAEIFFRTPTVTGTETFMMAAVLAEGVTVLKNAAMEPEIAWLAEILNACGARIAGAGTSTITIKGGKQLSAKGHSFAILPDRIEAGSFLILGALAAKELTITHCVPEHLEALIEMLEFAGVEVKRAKQSLSVSARVQKSPPRSIPVKTHEYPGFPTDLQAPMTVFLTQSKGENIVFETIFEGRLNFTEGLNRMGAQITMMDPHRVLVKGPTPLRGKRLESPDLRAGLAFIIAAIIAEGTSEIFNVYYVDRGYEHVEERLRSIGVQIERCTVP